MMAWMSDGVANPSKEIKRPGLGDGQTEGYLSNKQDEQDFAKDVSHLSWRILTISSNRSMTRRVKLNRRGLFLCFSRNVSSKGPATA
jgi:hypothetical protein